MTFRNIHNIIREANAIGAEHNVFVTYKYILNSFTFKFFRRGQVKNIYLGSSMLPDMVIPRMKKYCQGK